MDLLKKLISIPSVSGNESEIQKFIFEWLTKNGLKPIKQENNLVIHIKGKNQNKAMIFDAHVDTVSPGSLNMWSNSPFEPVIKNLKIYGLGASDEKSGVCSLMLLAKILLEKKPPVDIWFVFVTQEEIDGNGSKDFVKWFNLNYQSKYKNLAAVLPEPTGLNWVEIGHKGNVFVKLTAIGKTGHGSRPLSEYENSVLIMLKALGDLNQLNKKWSQKPDPIFGAPTIGIGTSIGGGDIQSPNKFADSCWVICDVRTVPQMHDQVFEIISKELNKLPIKVEYLHPPAPFGFTDKSDQLLKAVKKVIPEIKFKISPGATDQCFFTKANIPAIILGPGESKAMHIENEWCEVNKLKQAVSIYLKLISNWSKITV